MFKNICLLLHYLATKVEGAYISHYSNIIDIREC